MGVSAVLPLRLPAALHSAQDYFPVLKMGKLSHEVTGPRWLISSATEPIKACFQTSSLF